MVSGAAFSVVGVSGLANRWSFMLGQNSLNQDNFKTCQTFWHLIHIFSYNCVVL